MNMVKKRNNTGDGDDVSRVVQNEEDGNRIYFYADVECETIFELTRLIHEKSIKLLDLANRYNIQVPFIDLHINSEGGETVHGLAGHDLLIKSKVPIRTFIEGQALSAATYLSLAGKERYMRENSYVLIHSVFCENVDGTYENMKDDFQNTEQLMTAMKNIYKKYTKIPSKTLEEMMKRDIYLDSKTCLKYGIVDYII